MTVQELAAIAELALETCYRADGTRFVRVRDGSPEWITDMVRDAHGDMLPDDYIYSYVQDTVEALAQGYDPEPEPDCYHRDLLAWVGSHGERSAYVDDAIENGDGTLWGALAWGQASERNVVATAVVAFLENMEDNDE